jgi:hypothetical protein
MMNFPLVQAGWAAFGNDYRELVSVTGATNTGTSVSISTSGAANYVIDPYSTNSALTGTPSSSVPSGYGWRTTSFQGQVIPAGTWSFAVQTNTSGVTLGTGTAFMRVNAYHTDTLGQDVQLIGTATGNQDILTLLGGTLNHSLAFSASGVNLTNRVLVVEYWIIVTQPPLLGATAAFHTVSNVASVQLPASPAVTYYLSTPQLHSMGLDDAITANETTSQIYSPARALQDSVSVADATSIQVTRSIDDGMAITEELSTGLLQHPNGGGGTPVDITTYPGSYFEENPLERIRIIETAFLIERSGQHVRLTEVNPDEVVISTVFKNYQRVEQPYVCFVLKNKLDTTFSMAESNNYIMWSIHMLMRPS